MKKVYFLSRDGRTPTRESVIDAMKAAFPKKRTPRMIIRAGSEFHKTEILAKLLNASDYIFVVTPNDDGIDIIRGKELKRYLDTHDYADAWEACINYLKKPN